MARRPLVLVVGTASVVALGLVGWQVSRANEAEALVASATVRLEAPLREAPELHDLEAGDALAELEEAERLGAGNPRLQGRAKALVELLRGDLLEAEGTLSAARQRFGWDPTLRVIAASIARGRLDPEDARANVREALGMEPDDPRALLLEADLALDRGEAGPARTALERLVRLDDEVAAVHNRLGIARELLGEDGRAQFERAVALDETHHDAWVNLGRGRRAAGELEAAEEAFDAALRHAPGDASAWLGRGLVAADRGEVEEAEAALERAKELDPNAAAPWMAEGELREANGAIDAAVEAYREGLRREDGDGASWVRLGNALVRRGDLEGACDAFGEAIRRAPRLAAAHNGMGTARMMRGEDAAALEALQRAASLDTDDANPLLNMALLRQRRGDVEGAAAAWREALSRDPRSEVARDALARLR